MKSCLYKYVCLQNSGHRSQLNWLDPPEMHSYIARPRAVAKVFNLLLADRKKFALFYQPTHTLHSEILFYIITIVTI